MSFPVETAKTFLREREPEMLALLERIVRINSHSENVKGVNAVGAALRQTMIDMGFAVAVDAHTRCGNNLVAKNTLQDTPGPRILLCGHMDTVFPDDGSFDCFERRGDRIIGPGVIDMKGGLVVAIYALRALQSLGLLDEIPVSFIFNSDEEIGSPCSRDLIINQAKTCAAAFVFECAGLKGQAATGRKGKISFDVETTGESGHAGNRPGGKASAILELAHKTIALEALNDPDKDVSVNVGVVSGGLGPNTIAPSARARVEARYRTARDGRELEDAVAGIMAAPVIPGTTAGAERIPGRPAMETTAHIRELYAVARDAARETGLPFGEEFRGGVSDANFIAHAGVPVLDGLGPVGDLDHSPNEYMVTASLAERALLAACVIRRTFEALCSGRLFIRPELG